MNEEKLKEIHKEFMEEHNVMDFANGCGIGVSPSYTVSEPESNNDIGFVIYFETKADMKRFPFKQEKYKDVPVFKVVIGKIVAL